MTENKKENDFKYELMAIDGGYMEFELSSGLYKITRDAEGFVMTNDRSGYSRKFKIEDIDKMIGIIERMVEDEDCF